jgi:hypothetical protein
VGERFIGNSDFAEIDKTPSRSGFAGISMQIERGNGQNRRFSARCAIPRLESLPAKPQKRSGLPRARAVRRKNFIVRRFIFWAQIRNRPAAHELAHVCLHRDTADHIACLCDAFDRPQTTIVSAWLRDASQPGWGMRSQ